MQRVADSTATTTLVASYSHMEEVPGVDASASRVVLASKDAPASASTSAFTSACGPASVASWDSFATEEEGPSSCSSIAATFEDALGVHLQIDYQSFTASEQGSLGLHDSHSCLLTHH